MIAAVGYLMYTGIRETSTYYLTLEEFLPQKDALANAGVRVAGRVKSGSVDWNPKNLKLNFTMIGLDQNGQPVDTPTGVWPCTTRACCPTCLPRGGM